MQWNAQEIRNQKDERSEMINQYKSNIIAIQETKLWSGTNFSIPQFNEIRQDGQYNRGPHGGVALYIHNSIPYKQVQVTTYSNTNRPLSEMNKETDLWLIPYHRGFLWVPRCS